MSTATKTRRPPQKRGVARRKVLLEAARDLLSSRSLNEISYQDIADRAGIPLPSCYHFYSSKLELISALAEYLTPEYYDKVFAPYPAEEIETWQDIIEIFVQRSIEYYEVSPAARQVQLGPQTPAEVRLESQVRERKIGVRLQELVDRHFVLPEISDADRIFFNSVEIARLMVSLGQIEHGYITDISANEAFRAQIAYLQQYIPPTLKRRS